MSLTISSGAWLTRPARRWTSPIAGHLPGPRAAPRVGGYFNSGTWSQLIALTPVLLGDAALCGGAGGAMRAHSMQALKSVPGFVYPRHRGLRA